MVEQADVYVKNNLGDNIRAVRYCLPGDNSDLDVSIAKGNEEMIYIAREESYLTVTLPKSLYTSDCVFSVSNEDLLSWSTMDDHWTVEIKPNNNVPPDVPTTVNVDIGEDET